MSRTAAKFLSLLVMLSIISLSVPVTSAQTQNTGAIQGRVFEAVSIAPLPGATVTVTHEDIGLERTTVTNAEGVYYVGILPAGRYRISASRQGYENDANPENSIIRNFLIHITNTEKADQPPPITLQKVAAVVTPPVTQPPTTQPPTTQPQPTTPPPATQPSATTQRASSQTSPATESSAELLANTTNATRGGNFGELSLLALPLPGVRTFDDLAFLVAGVAPPPQAIGAGVGPGIGPGVGTSGQFSVNGLRSRSNNFTIDGSDNNDEEIGVRRQGFTSLVPQSIESVQEFQISTLLPEPQFGRNLGAQVNAVSRSGGSGYHGTLYGFFTDKRLKARDPFDFTGGPATTTLVANGRRVQLDGSDLIINNPVGDENPYRRGQFGFVFGGPVVKQKTYFFVSSEHQDIRAQRESHFAVPTVEQRGLFNTGATGFPVSVNGVNKSLFPTNSAGDAFFSLFPFPNNPIGPYGPNTFTEVLPASAKGTIFSGKLDHNVGKNHILSGRYNFTDDNTILPYTGEALFSSVRALIRTQDFAVSFNSALSNNVANQARFSYGRTSLNFREVRDPLLVPSDRFPDIPFLLNAPVIENLTLPGIGPTFSTSSSNTEEFTGPLGQVRVSGYSPIGVDVFYFPQARANNTFQYADTLIYNRQRHRFTVGFDIRQSQLNNRLERNSRPLAVFSAAADLSDLVDAIDPNSQRGKITDEFSSVAVPGFLLGRDFVAAGAPTGFFQTQSTVADPTIRLRYLQNNFFFSDQMRLGSRFTLTLGLRYELNTVPTEVDRRIESTFDSQPLKDFIAFERNFMRQNFNRDVSGLEQFLGGRKKIFEQDNNNLAPHIAFAWDPFGKGRTSIRGGYGIYYDQIPGFVISQSSRVFPTFLNLNFAGGVRSTDEGAPFLQDLMLSNPANIAVPGTLNTFNSQANPDPFRFILQQELATAFASAPSFVLPAADLVTPYAQHWGLTLEQAFKNDFLASVAYVGTKGTHLLRTATPNLGPNSIPVVDSIQVPPGNCAANNELVCVPTFRGIVVPPNVAGRPFPLLGSITIFESDASSIYHSLQLQLFKRFSNGIQFTTAYTWSHAIDEASDLFDLAGTRALPQNSFDRRAERADASFDVRHRFVYSFIWDLPIFRDNNILGGWQLASIGTFQTGQPYTLLNCCDQNQDGNLTDRIGNRNAFRAPGIEKVDMALNKNFRFGDRQRLEFRTEVFNLFNRTHFGIPIHQFFFANLRTEAATEQHFVDTRIPERTIQFALKYSF